MPSSALNPARLTALVAHRLAREAAILSHLSQGPATAATLAHAIYTTTPQALIPAATRNVLAHLIDLAAQGKATAGPGPLQTARFTRA